MVFEPDTCTVALVVATVAISIDLRIQFIKLRLFRKPEGRLFALITGGRVLVKYPNDMQPKRRPPIFTDSLTLTTLNL